MSMPYGNMRLTVETVTPSIAEKWMQTNDCNRRIRTGDVARYARAMTRGEWEAKPLAVCFDQDGRLGNGQHTLSAIIQSGKAQPLLVARGCTKQQIAAMDMGRARTVTDVANFIGAEVTSKKAAVARVVVFGPTDGVPRSFQELFEAYEIHRENIDKVVDVAPRKAGFSAAVLAVCVKAMHQHDHEIVLRFLEIMRTGVIAGPHEEAAIRLRDMCLSARLGSSYQIKQEIYGKACNALFAFVNRKPLPRLYAASSDLFALPDMLMKGAELGAKRAA